MSAPECDTFTVTIGHDGLDAALQRAGFLPVRPGDIVNGTIIRVRLPGSSDLTEVNDLRNRVRELENMVRGLGGAPRFPPQGLTAGQPDHASGQEQQPSVATSVLNPNAAPFNTSRRSYQQEVADRYRNGGFPSYNNRHDNRELDAASGLLALSANARPLNNVPGPYQQNPHERYGNEEVQGLSRQYDDQEYEAAFGLLRLDPNAPNTRHTDDEQQAASGLLRLGLNTQVFSNRPRPYQQEHGYFGNGSGYTSAGIHQPGHFSFERSTGHRAFTAPAHQPQCQDQARPIEGPHRAFHAGDDPQESEEMDRSSEHGEGLSGEEDGLSAGEPDSSNHGDENVVPENDE